MQTIISWNVASVRARLPLLLDFLKREKPDVMLLQEIKSTEETFPFLDLRTVGYQAVISGQKGFNGVAVLIRSEQTVTNVLTNLPDFQDNQPAQARFCQVESGGVIYISAYVPNGNPPEKDPLNTERLNYKLKWMNALTEYVKKLVNSGQSVILGGDFNVIERDTDVFNPDLYQSNALMIAPVREAYAKLQSIPLFNAVRQFHPEPHTYSFWDFTMGAWQKNNGMLLDAIFVSENMHELVVGAVIYKDMRGKMKPSDHVPVSCVLKD